MNQTLLTGEESIEYRVLLLEDNRDLAELLSEFLTAHRCVVTTVSNGAQGIQKIVASDFDFILCDIGMPGFPGDKFYLAVERVKPHLRWRFVFMTGHPADPRIAAFLRETPGVLLWKPFQLHDLLTAMKTVRRRYLRQSGKAIAPQTTSAVQISPPDLLG